MGGPVASDDPRICTSVSNPVNESFQRGQRFSKGSESFEFEIWASSRFLNSNDSDPFENPGYERSRIAVRAYTSAHSSSLGTDTNSCGPWATESRPGP